MMARRFILSVILPLLLLSGCAGEEREDPRLSLTVPSVPTDPDDAALDHAMRAKFSEAGMPQSSRFQYVRVDLDGDGRRDALVLMTAPFGTWCDLYGCTLYVMKASNDDFSFISEIRPVRTPLRVGDTRTHGWRDLIARIDGRWSRSHDVALRFDGAGYPAAPEDEPPLPEYVVAEVGGINVFP